MKVLVISQMFPCKRHPTSAIFFANLLRQWAVHLDELIVVTPRPYIPHIFIKLKKKWRRWRLDPMVSKEKGMEIIRPYILSLPFEAFVGVNGLLMQISMLYFLKKIIKARKVDLLLGYNILPEGFATVCLGKMLHLPAGFWVIGSDLNKFANSNLINKYFSKKAVRNANIILTNSKNLELKIRRFYPKHQKVKTFYKGIDISNFQNLPPKNVLFKHLNLSPLKQYILFAGRLIRDKGIYELADAFKIISKNYKNVDLLFIGEEIEKS